MEEAHRLKMVQLRGFYASQGVTKGDVALAKLVVFKEEEVLKALIAK
jgi:hypothetical protein